ncbi:hypothetical protein L6452_31829 [Arctium lappa]|uniref:Uncharacterized protein n=1 Tax=Arctium lappa TaxID=4217 RepID=A0ACB8Z343_ARCLA|nr:hypothetical protein L6452_31829 [Arctium lappa]
MALGLAESPGLDGRISTPADCRESVGGVGGLALETFLNLLRGEGGEEVECRRFEVWGVTWITAEGGVGGLALETFLNLLRGEGGEEVECRRFEVWGVTWITAEGTFGGMAIWASAAVPVAIEDLLLADVTKEGEEGSTTVEGPLDTGVSLVSPHCRSGEFMKESIPGSRGRSV